MPFPSITGRCSLAAAPVASVLITFVALAVFTGPAIPGGAVIRSMYSDRSVFLHAIASEKPHTATNIRVTGISLPHHLPAADLIARGFWAAAGNGYDRIIVLSPDHFNKSQRPLATTRSDFDTVFGLLENDRKASGALLEVTDLFDDSDRLFENEHGIAALLPFIKYFFPSAKIVPIAMSASGTRADWDRAFVILKKLIGSGDLVVQSTDYSHYLPLGVALQRDQETLNIIAANDLESVLQLVQPTHMDSKAAQYLQMQLQRDTFKSHPIVIGNRNFDRQGKGRSTTSYIVTVYAETSATGSAFRYADQQVTYFAGDTLLGRWFTAPLADPKVISAIVEQVKAITGGSSLIVNLEGVLLDSPPEGIPEELHFMHSKLAIPILKSLNVKAAGLANNHSFDLGRAGYWETLSILKRARIKALRHKEVVDLGPFRVLALNFIGNPERSAYPIAEKNDIVTFCRMRARPPVIAFVHWGQEYTTVTRSPEDIVAAALKECGVSAIIGAHSHRAAERIEAMQGGEYQRVFSLGNFLFDQKADRSSGALLELRVFNQGTFATRLIPIPNLFDFANARLGVP
jgi:AmmeMemoRadiSam system protein B